MTHLLGTKAIEDRLTEFILEKSEGVPFFIEEFIKSLKDLKIIVNNIEDRSDNSTRFLVIGRELLTASGLYAGLYRMQFSDVAQEDA